MIVVRDAPEEMVLALLPGAECLIEETYSNGKKAANRLWDFKEKDWKLTPFHWRSNRVLILHEPDRFYSVRLFWPESNKEFSSYYVNFQLPFKRNPCGFDTRDLELDLDIDPDLNVYWKDRDDYQKAIDHGLISPEWVRAIEADISGILEKLEKRQYPFDGSWLDWKPDPGWAGPKLPENWDIL